MAEEDKKEETPNWDSKISELEAKIVSMENQGKAAKAKELEAKLARMEEEAKKSSQTPKRDDAPAVKDTGKPEELTGSREEPEPKQDGVRTVRRKLVGFW